MASKQLLQYREKSKHAFNDILYKLINTTEFRSVWNNKFPEFSIQQLQQHHFVQTINILCYQFSSTGSYWAQPFQTTITDTFSWIGMGSLLQHAINTGLGYVVLNKYNHVIAVFFGNDECDIDPKKNQKHDISSIPKNIQHIKEIFAVNYPQNVMYKKYIMPLKNKVKYGEIFEYDVGAVKPEYQNMKIAAYCIALMDAIIFSMNYKYMYLDCVHPKTIHFRDRVLKNYGLEIDYKSFNFGNYTFKDNTNMQKYFDHLKYIYGFTDEYVTKLQQKYCILKPYVIDLHKLSSYKPLDLWKTSIMRSSKL